MSKFYCVCSRCAKHSDDTTTIEINFMDGKMRYVCPFCRKENEITIEHKPPKLPKVRTAR